MTSKKSSVNTFMFTFLQTIKKTCWLPIVFFVIALITHITPVLKLAKDSALSVELFGLEKIDFIFFNGSDDIITLLFSFSMYVFPAALAFIIFRYVMNKSSVNVYFSLGVSRTSMFLSKYAAGCVMLVLAVSIPLCVSALLNIIILGSSAKMWIPFAYVLINYVLFVLNIFAVTSLLFALVGTSFEAIVYSVISLASPVMLYTFADSLASNYLVGSPYFKVPWATLAHSFYIIGEGTYFSDIISISEPLIMFPFSPNLKSMNYVQYAQPYEFSHSLFWFFMVVAVSVFACIAYKRRKAEIAGFMGSNSFVTCTAIFIVSAFISTFVVDSVLTSISKVTLLLIAVLVFIVVYLVVNFISYRSFKKVKRKIWRLPVMVGAYFAVILLTVVLGFFYKNKLPDIEKIKSVSIETETGDVFLKASGIGMDKLYYSSYNNDMALYPAAILADEFYDHTCVSGFTSATDIERAVGIHKKLIDCNKISIDNKSFFASHNKRLVPVSISVIYELEDGSRLTRSFYCATNDILTQLAEFTKSERYKKLATDCIINGEPEEEANYFYYINYNDTEIAFASPNLSKVTEMPEYKGQGNFNQLFADALCKDIENGTFSLDFRNDSELIGYVIFNQTHNLIGGPYADSHTGYNGETIVDFPDGRSIAITDGMDINSYASFYSMQSEYTRTVPVYRNMTNVVSLLESSGYISLFGNEKTPVQIKLWEYQPYDINYRWLYYKGSTMLFSGMWFSGSFERSNSDYNNVDKPVMPDGYITVTHDKMEQVEKDLRLVYLTCYDGYYAELIYDDGSSVFGYVPK